MLVWTSARGTTLVQTARAERDQQPEQKTSRESAEFILELRSDQRRHQQSITRNTAFRQAASNHSLKNGTAGKCN